MLRCFSRSQKKTSLGFKSHSSRIFRMLVEASCSISCSEREKRLVWVSDLDSLLTSRCYRMFGSATPPEFDFQVSKTLFSLDSSALFASFFRLGFKCRFATHLSMRLSHVGSALPPSFGFQVSKTQFSLEGIALSTFFFSIGFQASVVSQESTVLLRVSFL